MSLAERVLSKQVILGLLSDPVKGVEAGDADQEDANIERGVHFLVFSLQPVISESLFFDHIPFKQNATCSEEGDKFFRKSETIKVIGQSYRSK